MFDTLPKDYKKFIDWSWSKLEPYAQDLLDRPLDESNFIEWLTDWSNLSKVIDEMENRIYVATTVDTTDKEAEERFDRFFDEVYPKAEASSQKLKEKLLDSGLEPEGFEIPLRNMKTEADIYREKNLPLLSEEYKLSTEYDKIAGAQTVEWEGEVITLEQLRPVYQDTDRSVRERAWRLATENWLENRDTYNELWGKFMDTRIQITDNADFDNYRSYRWKQMLRFDYTPDDCVLFQDAIDKVVVPVAQRIYDKRRQRLNVDTLRPWDLDVDFFGRDPLRPFSDIAELEEKSQNIFSRVDPQLGDYFGIMREENYLDLNNRKGKAPGGYCTSYDVVQRPFIFMNAVGLHDDVQTLLHEGGHAFHVFESAQLPYYHQLNVGMEFAEVASMAMELLTAPYLKASKGGFYSDQEAARARIEHLENAILFWPYMAVVDAFQHWVYENPELSKQPANCDAKWSLLWHRFMVGVDWSGFDNAMMTGWHRKLHIFQVPFYYIEYGLAQLGALQVYRNALDDRVGAVVAYRKSLSLGGTVSIPELFNTAGARLAFDANTLSDAVRMAEEVISELEAI
jgi:oligoendopeptidase F